MAYDETPAVLFFPVSRVEVTPFNSPGWPEFAIDGATLALHATKATIPIAHLDAVDVRADD